MVKASTFQRLKQIRDKYGPGLFGKITQKLLALAFYECGYCHVVERGVQGVDIDASTAEGTRYALEVKTTGSQSVPLSRENVDALRDRAKDGYTPVLAVLRLQMLEDWMLAAVPLALLRQGPFMLSRLRPYRLAALEQIIRPVFERTVEQHHGSVFAGGESFLIELLGQRRAEPRR